MSNGTLRMYLKENPTADRPRLLRETADAIGFLHQSGLIHGDLKADNVLVSGDIHALLIDFGQTQACENATTTVASDRGTLRWMGPELWNGHPKSPASDTYSFGMTVIEVLTGKAPFAECKTDLSVLHAMFVQRILIVKPSFDPTGLVASSYLWDIAEMCIVAEPDKRPEMVIVHLLLDQFTWAGDSFSELPLIPAPRLRILLEHARRAVGASINFTIPTREITVPIRTLKPRLVATCSMLAETYPIRDLTQSEYLHLINQPLTIPSLAPLVFPLTIEKSKLEEPKPTDSPIGPCHVRFAIPPITPKSAKDEEPPEPTTVVLDSVEDLSTRLTKVGKSPAKYGGFSEVWKGELAPHNETVAIKCLRMIDVVNQGPVPPNERLDMRMKREMNVWIPLKHPRILKCLGFAMVNDRPSLVSPWCKNGDAREYLKHHPKCDRKAMVVQVAEGLVYLHGRKRPVVHYDVKLPNIIIGDNGEAMLTDFGVAKVVDEYNTGLTTMSPIAINLRYSSPEAIIRSPRNVSSDVYSFGCLALEIISNQGPFYKLTTTASILMAKSSGKIPDPKDYLGISADDPLWSLLRKCWTMDPRMRPTMEEVLQELHTLGYHA